MDKVVRISGLNFFSYLFPLFEKSEKKLTDKKYLLPDLSEYKKIEPLARVNVTYEEKGLYLLFSLNYPFQESNESDYRKGDSVELFFDTRDNKNAASITKFCHHFVFFPVSKTGREVTCFRLEDRHDFCDPNALEIKTTFDKTSYTLEVFVPSYCLHGYDPNQFDRLGFSYRVNRYKEDPLVFNVLSEEFAIEKSPSLWATLQFK